MSGSNILIPESQGLRQFVPRLNKTEEMSEEEYATNSTVSSSSSEDYTIISRGYLWNTEGNPQRLQKKRSKACGGYPSQYWDTTRRRVQY